MTRLYQWLRKGAAAFGAAALALAIAGPVQAQNQPPQAPSAKDAKDTTKEKTKDVKDTAKESKEATKESAATSKEAAKDSAQSAKKESNDSATNAKENMKDSSRDARGAAQQSSQKDRDTGRDSSRDARNERDANADRSAQPNRDAQNRNSQYRDNQSRDTQSAQGRDSQYRDNQNRDATGRDALNAGSQNRDARYDNRASRNNSQSTFRASDIRSADIGLWFDRSARDGLVISDIASQGAIAKLGFREGDRIVSVNGQRVSRDNDFIQYLFADNVRNDRVKVVVLRDNQEEVVYVQPNVLVDEYSNVQSDPLEEFGVVVDDRYDDRIVVWKVIPRSPAYYAGIRAGDVLVTFRGQPLASRQDFVRVVTNLDEGSVPVQVRRGDRTRDYAVDVPRMDNRAERRTAMRPNVDVERPNENREARIEDRRENRVENRNDNRPATPLRPRR